MLTVMRTVLEISATPGLQFTAICTFLDLTATLAFLFAVIGIVLLLAVAQDYIRPLTLSLGLGTCRSPSLPC